MHEGAIFVHPDDMLVKIADFFSVSADYLLGRDHVERNNGLTVDVTGLSPRQIEHIQLIVDNLRDNDK